MAENTVFTDQTILRLTTPGEEGDDFWASLTIPGKTFTDTITIPGNDTPLNKAFGELLGRIVAIGMDISLPDNDTELKIASIFEN